MIHNNWKKIEVKNIGTFENCVGEFYLIGLTIIPFEKIKIKVLEDKTKQFNCFNAYTNIQIVDFNDEDRCPYCVVGSGKTLEEALENTLNHYVELASIKSIREWKEDDFEFIDPTEF